MNGVEVVVVVLLLRQFLSHLFLVVCVCAACCCHHSAPQLAEIPFFGFLAAVEFVGRITDDEYRAMRADNTGERMGSD